MQSAPEAPQKMSTEEVVFYEENPSMFRNQPVGFVLTCILSLVGVGLIIFLAAFVGFVLVATILPILEAGNVL